MGDFLTGLIVVGLAALASVAGMVAVRRKAPLPSLISHHEVADPLLSVVGTLYAVLLGFLVVDAMNKFQLARTTVETEANSVADVFILAGGLPQPDRSAIQLGCLQYVKSVLEDEWQSMSGRKGSPRAAEAMHQLWRSILGAQPRSQESAIYQQLLAEQSQLSDNRRTRLLTAEARMPTVMWIVLICGAISTIVFTYFFGLENVRSQIVMTVLLSLTISLNIFLLIAYDSPFSGDLKVAPDGFRLDAEIFEHILKHPNS